MIPVLDNCDSQRGFPIGRGGYVVGKLGGEARLPSTRQGGRHFRARIEVFQTVAAPFPGDSLRRLRKRRLGLGGRAPLPPARLMGPHFLPRNEAFQSLAAPFPGDLSAETRKRRLGLRGRAPLPPARPGGAISFRELRLFNRLRRHFRSRGKFPGPSTAVMAGLVPSIHAVMLQKSPRILAIPSATSYKNRGFIECAESWRLLARPNRVDGRDPRV